MKIPVPSLKTIAIGVLLIITALLIFALVEAQKEIDSPESPRSTSQLTQPKIQDKTEFIDEMYSLHAKKRLGAGLSALTRSAALERSAKAKAEDMMERGYWAHTSPTGEEPWVFIGREYGGYLVAGENLSSGYLEATISFKGLVDSPTHLENIVKPEYRELGIWALPCSPTQGLGEDCKRGYLVVFHFAAP